jgi:hypothetical protein
MRSTKTHTRHKELTKMATTAPLDVLGAPAANFRLPTTEGRTLTLDDVAGEKGTVIVFICNHCPYVKAVIGRLVADARTLMAEGIGVAAICSMTQWPTLKIRSII